MPTRQLLPWVKSEHEAGISTWPGEVGFSVPHVCATVGIDTGPQTASWQMEVQPSRDMRTFCFSFMPLAGAELLC